MTKGNKQSSGVHLHVSELMAIADWLNRDLLMQPLTVKIVVSHNTGIGGSVAAIALDERGEIIATKNVTDYKEW